MLLIVRGLPGSGKTTWAKSLGYPVYEADDYFINDKGEYNFDFRKISHAHNHCFFNVETELLAGNDCIVSNTFTRIWEMERYIDLCKHLNIEYTVVRITTQYKNVHGVPEDVVEKMRQRMEDFEGEVIVR